MQKCACFFKDDNKMNTISSSKINLQGQPLKTIQKKPNKKV